MSLYFDTNDKVTALIASIIPTNLDIKVEAQLAIVRNDMKPLIKKLLTHVRTELVATLSDTSIIPIPSDGGAAVKTLTIAALT